MIPGTSLNIACYLFLGGMGAGLYAIWYGQRAFARLAARHTGIQQNKHPNRFDDARDAYRSDGSVEQLASVGLVWCGCLFLLCDLGIFERFLLVFAKPLSSVISFGAWSILLFSAFALARFFAKHTRRLQCVCPVFSTCAFACALVVCTYTGVYLYSLGPAIPLWSSPLVIAVFFVSALGTGCDAFLAINAFINPRVENKMPLLASTAEFEAAVKTIEALALALFLGATLIDGQAAACALALQLITGPWAVRFWVFAVGLGIIAPIAAHLLSRLSEIPEIPIILASFCGMAGGLALRCCIIFV